MNYLLGIDAGTTAVKAAVFDSVEGLVASADIDCSLSYNAGDTVEIDMRRYWQACLQCLSQLSAKGVNLKDIRALAISSQGVTFVPVDSDGVELGNGIAYYDIRAVKEARELLEKFGQDKIYEVAGQPAISAVFEAAKLLWIRNNQPDRFQKIHKVLLVQDYLVFKLTGEFVCPRSLISSSLLYDVKQQKWWDLMLDFVGLQSEHFPTICEHGAPIGNITPLAADETGLAPNTLVVGGAIDQLCGMIGVGNVRPAIVSESTGTVLAIHTVSSRMFGSEETGVYNFCGVNKDYVWISVCPTAGSALNWFKEGFGFEEQAVAARINANVFELLTDKASSIPAGSDGLIMFPYLAGQGSPRPNPNASGVFWGIKLHHRRAHFVRALMESVAYMLRENIEVFRNAGISFSQISSFGGGARSTLWNQIKADVCNLPVVTSKASETGCLGAAILAGVGRGIYRDIEEGCSLLVSPNDPVEPRSDNVRVYEESYHQYLKLSKRMELMFDQV